MNLREIEKKELTLEIERLNLERKLNQIRRKLKELTNIKPLVIRHETREKNDKQVMTQEIERLVQGSEQKRKWYVALKLDN